MPGASIVEYFGEQKEYRCGYCKSDDTNYSHGMWAHMMTPQDYQSLIDRGWRRSGKYVYKPTNHLTCCPAYTIRCNALEASLTKSQKKVLKRFSRYLSGEIPLATKDIEDKAMDTVFHDGETVSAVSPTEGVKMSLNSEPAKVSSPEKAEETSVPLVTQSSDVASSLKTHQSTVSVMKESLSCDRSDTVVMNPKPRKAKEIRMERKKNKLLQRGVDPSNIQWKKRTGAQPKSLEDLIMCPDSANFKFSIRTVKVDTPEFEETFNLEHELYRSYQMNVHNDEESECTRKQFKRFLCDNPFGASDDVYGTYHQQYYLDDTLIAVGVVDILPVCLSSVYFFYSTNHMNLSLGTFGALREIAYVRELNRSNPDIRYYYMGFYIHSCVKMRYKGCFSPSYLLCPEVYTWHLLDDPTRAELSAKKYIRLNKSTDVKPVDENSANAGILHDSTRMTYKIYASISGTSDKKEVQEYVNLVGKRCAESMLLYRS